MRFFLVEGRFVRRLLEWLTGVTLDPGEGSPLQNQRCVIFCDRHVYTQILRCIVLFAQASLNFVEFKYSQATVLAFSILLVDHCVYVAMILLE